MSKDNQTVEILQNNLDENLAWRLKELTLIKNKIPRDKNDEQNTLIRAGITLLYAHWEGFIKYGSECYLQHVSLQGLKHHELQYCFLALCMRKQLNELKKTNQFELQQLAVKFMFDELGKRAYIPYEGIIETKSNLTFTVFSDICTIIGVDYRQYELKKNLIDKQLVEPRNTIAHGKQYLRINYQNYLDIYRTIIQLMRNIKDDILNAAITEQYKRI